MRIIKIGQPGNIILVKTTIPKDPLQKALRTTDTLLNPAIIMLILSMPILVRDPPLLDLSMVPDLKTDLAEAEVEEAISSKGDNLQMALDPSILTREHFWVQ